LADEGGHNPGRDCGIALGQEGSLLGGSLPLDDGNGGDTGDI
jgi:hypothetical protein